MQAVPYIQHGAMLQLSHTSADTARNDAGALRGWLWQWHATARHVSMLWLCSASVETCAAQRNTLFIWRGVYAEPCSWCVVHTQGAFASTHLVGAEDEVLPAAVSLVVRLTSVSAVVMLTR
jgi:ABC-type Fe2+-enterobactin transport system substrate-binding protein